MKSLNSGRMIAALLLALMVLILPSLGGCVNPPKDTVYVNDEQGQTLGLAYDRNHDGQADQIPATREKLDPVTSQPVMDPATNKPVLELVLDENGKPVMVTEMVPGSGIYKIGEKTDAVVPAVLSGVGGFIPGGIGAVLVGLAAAWRSGRFGRIFANSVMSVQIARQRLKDGGHAEALKLLDEALDSGQLRATADEVARIKAKMGLPSVTG